MSWKEAIKSRCIVIILMMASFYMANEYDDSTSALDAFDSTCADNQNLLALTRPFVRWDAVHFLEIAQNGYTFEHQFAFFPGLPMLLRACVALVKPVLKPLNVCDRILYIVIGGLLSNGAFVMAAFSLYNLTWIVTRDKRLSERAALCFCMSTGGAFMSSVYTESLFALFTFQGMISYERGHFLIAALLWMVCTFLRANGVVYAGFFIWSLLTTRMSLKKTLLTILCVPIVTIPFFAFQYYGHLSFCQDQDLARPWCFRSFIYTFVQAEYWNNGFLKYFEWNQLGNFILAAPLIVVLSIGLFKYARHDIFRIISLGLFHKAHGLSHKAHGHAEETGFFSKRLLPYVYLAASLLFLNTTMMHVQTMNRFMTSAPFLYWTMASLNDPIVNLYIQVYGRIQSVLFGVFLPPA